MLRLNSVTLADFFEKLTFNAQFLYSIAIERPLEDKDIDSIFGPASKDSLNSLYLKLSHDEQKELLKAILTSNSLFDSISTRLATSEKNILAWDADHSISNARLTEMIACETYESLNFALQQIALTIAKASPSLFQKVVIQLLNSGFDVKKKIDEAMAAYELQVKKIKEDEKRAKEFLDAMNKFLPPMDPPNDVPPNEDDIAPDDKDEGKY